MGLDIDAYEKAELTPEHEYDPDQCDEHDHVRAFCDHGFERSLRGLIADRCYVVSGDRVEFRAGSYSGYNAWREMLSSAALGLSPEAVWDSNGELAECPFYELINFSDCEGTIGPEACAALAVDFVAHREKILAAYPEDERFEYLYGQWQQAFELAAGRGLVWFV